MNHFPNTFWGGVVITFILHLVAMWVYHRGPGAILSPISARWRSFSDRAREEWNRDIASLRNDKNGLILATQKELLHTVRYFGFLLLGIALVFIAASVQLLAKYLPAEVTGSRHSEAWQQLCGVGGLTFGILAQFELIRASNVSQLLKAARRPPSEESNPPA
jgi:hypothetical protein